MINASQAQTLHADLGKLENELLIVCRMLVNLGRVVETVMLWNKPCFTFDDGSRIVFGFTLTEATPAINK